MEKEFHQQDPFSVTISAYVTEIKPKNCEIPFNSIVLFILLGFLFIFMGIAELVSTFQSNSITIPLTQQGSVLINSQYTEVSFTDNVQVSLYLQIQNLTQFTHFNSIGWGQIEQINSAGTSCHNYQLNGELQKTTAIDGTVLDPNKVAIPCGFYAGMFPGYDVTVTYSNGTALPLDETDLTYFQYNVENFNISTQWVDLLSQPFQSWMEQNAQIVSTKLIGRLPTYFQGQIQIQITLTNGFPKTLGPISAVLTSNKSFGQMNVSFFVINFFQSACLFIFAFVIFYYGKLISKEIEEEGKVTGHEIELRSQAESQFAKTNHQ